MYPMMLGIVYFCGISVETMLDTINVLRTLKV